MLKQNVLYQALTTQSTHSEEAAVVEVVLFEQPPPNGPEGNVRVRRGYMGAGQLQEGRPMRVLHGADTN